MFSDDLILFRDMHIIYFIDDKDPIYLKYLVKKLLALYYKSQHQPSVD